MSTSSPKKKTIDIQANATTPRGATIRLTVEYRIRPPTPTEPGPIYEHVKMQKDIDVNMGINGQYKQQANYIYGNEKDTTSRYSSYEQIHDNNNTHTHTQLAPTNLNKLDDSYVVPEKVIEHISEDEKSTSSEEVVFEEWTEEFRCRRTDEYDGQTNRLLRTTIDETSDRIKGDHIKEEYKGKNTRIKGHKSYDVVKEVYQQPSKHIYEETPRPPLPSTSQDQRWTTEEVYTTEIVNDPRIVKELETTAGKFDSLSNYDRVRQSQYSPTPSKHYERISNIITPAVQQPDKRKEEDFISEEYTVEFETPTKGEKISGIDLGDQKSSTERDSDWRNKYKQIYTPPSDDDQSDTQKKPSSSDDNYFQTTPKRSSSSSSILNERRTQYESTDRPTLSRVGELKNAFEITRTESTKDDISKYKTSITPGLTEQRRRIFEDQERTRQPINDFHTNERRMSETHTAPSLVSDRISRFESTINKTTPQTSIDIKYKTRPVISSIDSDLSRPTQPIYQSTPKSIKQKYNEDAGHESEDELSDPKQNYDTRRRTSKTRSRDFSQSTSQPMDTNPVVQRTVSNFNEGNMENILSHVPTSKGKGILIELSPHTHQSPSKSNLISDSGVFDYSSVTSSQQVPTSSPSWRHHVSTSIVDDTIRSPYTQRYISDTDQTTVQNVDDSVSRSIYKYDGAILPNQQQYRQRTVRRQLTNSPPTDYETLTNYHSRVDTQGKVPITTQSRTIKPLIVDEIETIETETNVHCDVQRTNEFKESTKSEQTSPSKTILTTSRSSNETTPAKRVLLNDRPQYYESPKQETRFQPIAHNYSQDDLPYGSLSRTYNNTIPQTMEVTSLSPRNQITFNKHSPNEIVAVIRVPEASNTTLRHGTSESNIYEKTKQQEERSPRLHYQRVNASSYRPPLIAPSYQPREARSRLSPYETKNDYSSPINIPVRSASYHTTLHDQSPQQQQQYRQQQYHPYRSQTRYHSGSLGNLFGSNLEFEIEIEKRPPAQPEQPTTISLDQCSRAIVTTSKDGRVSIQNVAAYPGNTVVINSDYHSSDRSLNRSSGYFSSDEPRSQGHTTNYSSDEQSSGAHQNAYSQHYKTNEQNSRPYHFDQANEIIQHYSQPSTNFNEAINQIDALYSNLDVQTNDQRPYDFSKLNRRKQLQQNPTEYSQRYTSTGFQHIPYEQQTTLNNNNQNWTSSAVDNLAMSTPIRPSYSLSSSGILADYGTPGSISPNSTVQQNRLNGQAQIVQRNRTSVKQVKQKSAAKKRNGNIQGQYSDEDDDNDSPLSDYGRSQSANQYYNFNNHQQ